MVTQPNTTNKPPSHKVRTFFASLLGTVAISLIILSVSVVWLNRTLTDTNTYVATVAPLASNPDVQDFVSQNISNQIINSMPIEALAKGLLPSKDLSAHKTAQQLKSLVKARIEQNVHEVVASPKFAKLWQTTNQTIHASLVKQLNSNDDTLRLNFAQAIKGVVSELKQTQFKVIADKIDLKPNSGVVVLKSDSINRFRSLYRLFKAATIAIVIVAILACVSAIWLSVHHGKTARRILTGVGVLLLLQALLLTAPSVVNLPGADHTTQAATKAIAQALLHNLQIASLIIGLMCLAGALGSKIYVKYQQRGQGKSATPTTPV